MEYSTTLQKRAKSYGVTPQYLILADLKLSGYADGDAYNIAFPENATLAPQQNKKLRDNILKSTKFQDLLEQRQSELGVMAQSSDLRDKETVARELNALISQTSDPKLKAELLMKLADLQQMKKDATAIDEDPVKFFLSLDCEKCPLLQAYNDFLSERNEALDKEEQSAPLRPDEIQRIVEQAHPTIHKARAKTK